MFGKLLEYLHKLCYSMFRVKVCRENGDTMSKFNYELGKMASDILVKNDTFKLPVDLIAIANNNNIEVYKQQLPDGISGAIRYSDSTKKFQILLEEREPINRQRFTLAHELAHFFLEREKLLIDQEVHFDPKFRRYHNKEEERVDYLAGAILMDKKMLSVLYKINPSISVLAKTFNVSESSMTVRLMILGLIK